MGWLGTIDNYRRYLTTTKTWSKRTHRTTKNALGSFSVEMVENLLAMVDGVAIG